MSPSAVVNLVSKASKAEAEDVPSGNTSVSTVEIFVDNADKPVVLSSIAD